MRFRRICCSDCWRARKQGGPVGVRMLINSVSCSSLSNRQRVSTLNALGSGEIVYVSCTGNTPGNACALTFFARQGFGVVVVPLVAKCSTRIGGTVDGGNIAPPNQNLAAATRPPSSSTTAPGARPRASPCPPPHPHAQCCGLGRQGGGGFLFSRRSPPSSPMAGPGGHLRALPNIKRGGRGGQVRRTRAGRRCLRGGPNFMSINR